MVFIDRARLAPGNTTPTDASKRLPVEEKPTTENGIRGQNTQAAPTDYTIDQIASHEESGDDLCYSVYWYEYSPEHGTLEAVEHLPQHFVHCS